MEIKNFYGVGVELFAPNNTVRNSRIHNNALCTLCTTGQAHGFYVTSPNNVIENNEIYDNGGYGVHAYKGGASNVSNDGIIIRNNRIYNNGRLSSEGGSGGFGIILSGGSNNRAYNNLVYGNGRGVGFGGGIQIYGCDLCTVYNNTVYDNASEGIAVTSSVNTTIKNNISSGNGGAGITDQGSGTISSNNLSNDPKFINPWINDFRLQSGSAAIDGGSDLSAEGVTLDLLGYSRPQGSGFDLGAYEYVP
jgi:parallel beta-helix repeat protein